MHLLPFHCLDVAATGRVLLQGNPTLLRFLANSARIGEPALLDWLCFCLALHDLGKFAASFQHQRPDLQRALQGRERARPYPVRHDSLGELLWRRHLLARADVLGLGPQAGRYERRFAPWVGAVTGHHGEPPDAGTVSLLANFDACDEAAAVAFVAEVKSLFPIRTAVETLTALSAEDAIRAGNSCSWWLAGVAVLADWLGSNADYFRYESNPMDLAAYWNRIALPAAERAVAAAGVLPQPVAAGHSLQDLFGRERIPTLTPLQAWADKIQVRGGPQLFLLEDVTGAGKTEAALTLAYRLMAAGEADGLFMALPTMATADAMFARVAQVAPRLFAPTATPSVVLAHGKRDLVPAFRATVLAPDCPEGDREQHDETASARCAAWLADHNKKSLLASVGVGTIDQALLAVLHARHQSLRLLGLFRKVLIVDEVHACDRYMQELLEGLLQFHAAAGGSAILASATLTGEMKNRLAAAFAAGRGWPAPSPSSTGYPLLSRMDAEGFEEIALDTRPEVRRRVEVTYLSDLTAVCTTIRSAIDAGRCVCWVRNTVADAVEAWSLLRQGLTSCICTLFHARFALGDRLAIEAELSGAFGPESTPAQRRGRLVIATQVVEQSLDVDFDLLISDLAPIDRLIQRAGRQQRHPRTADGARTRGTDQRGGVRMVVFGPHWTGQPEADWVSRFFPRGAAVYPHAGQLWLTARELVERGGFSMPDDARELIEGVFGPGAVYPESLQSKSNDAEGKAWAAVNLAFAARLKIETGYVRGTSGAWLADDAAPALASEDGWDLGAATRLGEATVTVRLARWVGGACVPWCDCGDAWELSGVRVIARHIGEPIIDPNRTVAFEAARTALPDQGKWSILLPFVRGEDGLWQAQAKDARGRLRHWTYDSQAGLREGQPGKQP